MVEGRFVDAGASLPRPRIDDRCAINDRCAISGIHKAHPLRCTPSHPYRLGVLLLGPQHSVRGRADVPDRVSNLYWTLWVMAGNTPSDPMLQDCNAPKVNEPNADIKRNRVCAL